MENKMFEKIFYKFRKNKNLFGLLLDVYLLKNKLLKKEETEYKKLTIKQNKMKNIIKQFKKENTHTNNFSKITKSCFIIFTFVILIFGGFFINTKSAFALAIGDTYGGGKVAYILQAGDPGYIADGMVRGLIATTADQGSAIWSCGGSVPGGTGTALGTGQQNTTNMINSCATLGTTARIAQSYNGGGYTDWYLPSKDELNKLYLNRVAIGNFDTTGGWYWSSSQWNANNAWVQAFYITFQGGAGINGAFSVRPVRSFVYDPTPLVISSTTPATNAYISTPKVSYTLSKAAVSATIAFIRTGGTADASAHSCSLQGIALTTGVHTNLLLTSDTNSCTTAFTALVNGSIYSVSFNATDAGGNSATQITNTSITYDTTVPTVSLTYSKTPTGTGTETITATYSKALTSTPNISIAQQGSAAITNVAMTSAGGNVYTYAYTVNPSNGTTYKDGIATVSLSATTDAAGNSSSAPTNNTFTIDTTPPVISSTTPATNAYISTPKVGYTLSKAAVSATIAFIRTGGTADASAHSCSLQGIALTTGVHTNLLLTSDTNSCTTAFTALVNGSIYSVSFNATDAGGNSATQITNTSITYDTTVPTVSLTYSKTPTGTGTETITATYSKAITSIPNISIDQQGSLDISGAAMTPMGGSVWTNRNATDIYDWNSVTYGNNLFVAVGFFAIMTSPDGITWTARTATEMNNWHSVTYGNNLFVSVSTDGTHRVMTSPDGINWTAQTAAEGNSWQSVTYGNGHFVAVANTGTHRVMTSPDGINWTAQTATEANGWTSVTYGNGLFVAVSFNGAHRVMTSPDGITWQARTATEANVWNSVTYGQGIFIAVSRDGINRVMTSSDGITWTARMVDTVNSWYAVTYGNGLFVSVSSATNILAVMTSPSSQYSYAYTVNPSNGTTYKDGTATVSLSATTDLAGNSSALPTNTTFQIEATPPVSTITPLCSTTPNKCSTGGAEVTPQQTYAVQTISGTASDNTALSKVELSIKDTTANKYYTSGSFSSDTEVYNGVTGTTTWSYDAGILPFTIGHTYQLNAKATDTVGSEYVATVSFVFANSTFDNTAPVITLNGTNPMSVTKGDTYTEPGATATDETDGTRDVSIGGTVNTSAVGAYNITYTATDLSGNVAHVTRVVNVVLAPTYNITATAGEHGTISPNGVTAVTSGTDQTFTFTPDVSAPDATVVENYKVSSISVDGQLLAPANSYTFTNVSTDHTIAVTFSLIDSAPPEITILGDNPMTIDTNTTFVDPGATAIDVFTNEPIQVTTTGVVNTNVAGTYKITYLAADASGNVSSKDRTVNVIDVTPPTISDVSTPVISSNAAVIVWTTNEPSTSQVSWGTKTGELTRDTILDNTLSTYHIVSLSSGTNDIAGAPNTLSPTTPYFYVVKSSDAALNSVVSGEGTFNTTNDGQISIFTITPSSSYLNGNGNQSNITADTTPPKITDMKISDITSFGATISFNTDESAISQINYGKTTDYGESTGGTYWKTFKTSHSIKLTGLAIGTDYHFRIVAVDKMGNVATGEDQTFKTKFFSENLADLAKIDNIEQFQKEVESTIESILPSLVPPFIEKPTVTDITENSATVNFRTNIKSFGVAGYVADGDFDASKANPYAIETSDTTNKTLDHALVLSNLKPNTKYRLQVRAFSLPQVVGKSKELTFITEASKIQATIVSKTNNSFTVVWNTDEPASSIVEYKDGKTGRVAKMTDDTKNKSHSIKVENLTPGTTYTVSVSGVNGEGNILEGNAPVMVTTSTDIIPPDITNLKVDSSLVAGRSDRIQSLVSWTTDEASTSTVYFEEGSGTTDQPLSNKQEDTATLTTNHVVVLSNLKPGTIYRLQIASTDEAGNQNKLPIRTIITPVKNESIVDIIFKNFDQTFNFLQNVR